MKIENIIYEYREVNHGKLSQYIIDNESLHKYFKEDWGKVKAKQYCGIINYNDDDFYILPKIAEDENSDKNLDIFIYMLRYVYDIKIDNEDLASSKNTNTNNLLDIFIQIFAKNLFREFQKGIYKEYITEQDNLTTLRGKYLINENLKYNFTKSKIYCEYDEFSEDNELNQFFLYAIKILMNFTTNTKLLKMCELVLCEVSYKKLDIKNINIHFNRLNQRFKNSFEFAMLLLKKSIPLFEKDKKSFAFLFDMNSLFEKFIGKIYQEIKTDTKLQYTQYFGNLKLIPDIYTDDLIIDVKYKKAKNKEDLKRDDKYQMFVYGINFRVNNTMLLYPKHLESIKEDLVLGKDDKMVVLKMRSIDLDFNGGYDDYIEVMKTKMRSII
ncbi:MAG: restriction endonuclease [Arcobacteraceae bacterium]